MSDIWFEIPYRDKTGMKYNIIVNRIINRPSGADKDQIHIIIKQNDSTISRFFIEFGGSWNSINFGKEEISCKDIGTDEYSAFVTNLIKEYIFKKEFEELRNLDFSFIGFHSRSEYNKNIFKNPKNGKLNYRRDTEKQIHENIFAREIVLREAYFLQISRGSFTRNELHDQCNYYYTSIRTAIDTLIGDNIIIEPQKDILKLSLNGQKQVESEFIKDKNLSMNRKNHDNANEQITYDVALSFAGEEREYVEKVANYLNENSTIKYFYDKHEVVTLWGEELVEHLHMVLSKASKYCVMFISKNYKDKVWPTHEKRSALEKQVKSKGRYILPVRFDDTELPGLQSTIGYINAADYSPEQLGELIIKKTEQAK